MRGGGAWRWASSRVLIVYKKYRLGSPARSRGARHCRSSAREVTRSMQACALSWLTRRDTSLFFPIQEQQMLHACDFRASARSLLGMCPRTHPSTGLIDIIRHFRSAGGCTFPVSALVEVLHHRLVRAFGGGGTRCRAGRVLLVDCERRVTATKGRQ